MPAVRPLPLGRVYRLIEPGPVVLLSTRSRQGVPNVMTMSWHMMMEFEPPLIGCIVSSGNHSFKALKATKECVISIPPVELAGLAVSAGNCTGRTTDKFAAFSIKVGEASQVRPPLLVECAANLECRVVDTRLVSKFNSFVIEVVAAWQAPGLSAKKMIHHRGYGEFAVDGDILKLNSKMP